VQHAQQENDEEEISAEDAEALNTHTAIEALTDVSTIGFLLADQQEGPFELEIQWISCGPKDLELTGKTRTQSDIAKTVIVANEVNAK
jgi:hypothetical protein